MCAKLRFQVLLCISNAVSLISLPLTKTGIFILDVLPGNFYRRCPPCYFIKTSQNTNSSTVKRFLHLFDLRNVAFRFSNVVHLKTSFFNFFITSPAGAVAKYCVKHVCLWVCLPVREDISRTTRAIFTKFFYACCLCPWLGPPPTCLRQTASPIAGKGFLSLKNALSARKGGWESTAWAVALLLFAIKNYLDV